MSKRSDKQAAARARRELVERAAHIVRNPPLWPWDAAQWQEPAPAERKGPGRPPKVQRPVDRMMEARGVLNRRYVKKAATARTAGERAAAARRQAGDPYRDRVLAEARILLERRNPPRDLAGKIAAILAAVDGAPHDVKHVRSILKTAGILPRK